MATTEHPFKYPAADLHAEARSLRHEGSEKDAQTYQAAGDYLLTALSWTELSEAYPPAKANYNPVSLPVIGEEYTGSMVLVCYDHFQERWLGLDYQPRIIRWHPLPPAKYPVP